LPIVCGSFGCANLENLSGEGAARRLSAQMSVLRPNSGNWRYRSRFRKPTFSKGKADCSR